jgi:inorganic triphosphatase YgiF
MGGLPLVPRPGFTRIVLWKQHAMAYRDEKNAVLKQALADLDNKRANVMKLTGIPGKERQRAIAEDEVVKVLDSVFRHACVV